MGLEEKVRVVPHRKDSAAFSLAIDRALLKMMNDGLNNGGQVTPIFRTYQFSKPAVVMGFNQKTEGRCDRQLARNNDVDITVRDTGGGHMYFSIEDIHFTLCASNGFVGGTLIEKYQYVNSIVANVLNDIGYNATLGRTSVRLNDDKLLVGTARRHARNAFLHHGAILVTPYNNTIFKLLMAREDEIRDWGEQVTCLSSFSNETYDLIPKRLTKSFVDSYVQDLTPEELNVAKDLYDSVYNNPSKIFSGKKDGDICLIAGERSTKDREQEGEL